MRCSHASRHAEARFAMTAAEFRRLRRMLQRERQKGLLALDLLTDAATQEDLAVDESCANGGQAWSQPVFTDKKCPA